LKAVSEMPQMEWSRTYSRVVNYTIDGCYVYPYDEGICVVQMADGGYVIAGQRDDRYYPPHTGGVDAYTSVLINTDSLGNVQWEKNNSEIFHPNSIVQTKDSGFILISRTGLFKLDKKGDVQWSKDFVEEYGDFDVAQTSDGSFVMAGSIESGYNVVTSVIKVDVNGNLLWNETFSSDSPYTVGMAVAEASEGGYVVAGTSGGDRLWLVKVDSNGKRLFDRTFAIFGNPMPVPPTNVVIDKTKDGGYILAGGILYGDHSSPWLAKIDSQGNLQWHQRYDDGGRFLSVVQVDNGGYLMSGSYSRSMGSLSSVLLVRTDGFGNFQWNATYDGEKQSTQRPNSASSAIATDDGGYAVVGTLDDNIWFVKYAPETEILPDTTPSGTTPSDAPTLFVAFVIVTVVIGVSFIVYFKKRKH
jgi:hypothetical protein